MLRLAWQTLVRRDFASPLCPLLHLSGAVLWGGTYLEFCTGREHLKELVGLALVQAGEDKLVFLCCLDPEAQAEPRSCIPGLGPAAAPG